MSPHTYRDEICLHPMPPKTSDDKIVEIVRFALENHDDVRLDKIAEVIKRRSEFERDLSKLIAL